MPDNTPIIKAHTLLGLEVLRFISAFSILLWHYQHFSYVANIPTGFLRERQPLYAVLGIFYNYGADGVKVFWCISGFIFFWKYREAVANGLISGKDFFILRFSRLYPLHVTTLFLAALLQLLYFKANSFFFVYQDNDAVHFFLQLFMGSAWGFDKGASYNGPIWSISLEVLVYFTFFFILRYISKSTRTIVAVLAACALAKAVNIHYLLFDALAFFYMGGLAADLSRKLRARRQNISPYVISFGILCSAPFTGWFFKTRHWDSFLFLIAYSPVLVFFASQDIRVRPAAQKFIKAAGNMTYSSYLIHFPIQISIALAYTASGMPMPLYDPLFLAFFLSATLLAAYFIYKYFEAPAQNYIRQRFL